MELPRNGIPYELPPPGPPLVRTVLISSRQFFGDPSESQARGQKHVISGGDFTRNRIVPDLISVVENRSPDDPVLGHKSSTAACAPLSGYLLLAEKPLDVSVVFQTA